MHSIIHKIFRLITDTRGIRGYISNSVFRERIDKILELYELSSLREITIEDLLRFYHKSIPEEIKIKIDFFNGISPPNDYYFLIFLAKTLDIKKYFEIGTWVGLSAYNIAENTNDASEIYTLDIPFDHPELKIFNIPEEVFGYYSRNHKKIQHLKCDSKHFDFSSYKKQFELVFVDGNHTFEYVKNDTKIALELLKDENSIIVWHDYYSSGEVNKLVLAGILDTIPQEEHKHLVSLSQSNIAMYSKSFNFNTAKQPDWQLPKNVFEMTVKLKSE